MSDRGGGGRGGPPGWAEALLRAVLPEGEEDAVLGDLEELRRERAREGRAGRAAAWYAAQALLVAAGFVAQGVVERLGRRRRSARGATGGPTEGGTTMGDWTREIRFATRALSRRPGFVAVTVGTLALGIGANTAIFSVVEATLLRPLPFPEPEELTWLSDRWKGGGSGNSMSIPNALDLRDGSALLEDLSFFKFSAVNLSTEADPERVRALSVDPRFFGVLGMPPTMGRAFLEGESLPEAAPVVVLGHGLWRERFGADPGVVGSTIRLDDRPHTVIGIADPDFTWRGEPRLFVPLRWDPTTPYRGARHVQGVGRLADGASLDAAEAELQGIFSRLEAEYPGVNENWTVDAIPLSRWFVGRDRSSFPLLAGAAALVLLIGCVNVANLVLVRAEGRQREIALRAALGAGRARLLPFFMSEGLVLAAAGGAVAVPLALVGTDALVALYGSGLPRADEIGVNTPTLLFALALTVGTGLLVGLVPLLRGGTGRLHADLSEGGRGAAAGGGGLGQGLVVLEVGLAVVLVAAAGLLINSFRNVAGVDPGLERPDDVLVFQLSLPEASYPERDDATGFVARLEDALRRKPGVRAVGLTSRLPTDGGSNVTTMSRMDDPEMEAHFVEIRSVTPGFFRAAGIPIEEGRAFTSDDGREGFDGLIATRELARRLWPAGDAVGGRVESWWADTVALRMVGVAADIRDMGPTREPPPGVYMPYGAVWAQRDLIVLVRAEGDPLALVSTVREEVAAQDPGLPVWGVRTLRDVVDESVGARRRVSVSLVAAFAAMALALGAVGIYGVMSYTVGRRTRELGVRLALGAGAGEVQRMVLVQGARVILLGLLLGLAGALAAGRLLAGLLYQVSPSDPATYAVVCGVLAAVAGAACWLPARRASRVDPVEALRAE